MSNQMKIVLKLKQKHHAIMLKKNKIIINLKKKKHIKLVVSPITKKSIKEKTNNNSYDMDYGYAYEMDRYDRDDRYDHYNSYDSYDHYEERCCTYDEDYGTYGEEKLYGDYDDYETYWDSIYN
jgi:hypothetical protein